MYLEQSIYYVSEFDLKNWNYRDEMVQCNRAKCDPYTVEIITN